LIDDCRVRVASGHGGLLERQHSGRAVSVQWHAAMGLCWVTEQLYVNLAFA